MPLGTVIENEKDKVVRFFDAVDEMIRGKFILSDVKITKILNCIGNCDTLYNLFTKCLMDFNFKQELKKSIVNTSVDGGLIVLPEDEERAIALVFHLLVEVDNKKINLQAFVNDYFYSSDGYNISYGNFARNILIPWKKAILNQLGLEEITDEDDSKINKGSVKTMREDNKINDNNKMLYAKLMVSLGDMYSAVLKDTKIKMEQKEEIYIIVNALNEATQLQNIKIINALIIPIEYLLGKNKKIKPYYDVVQDDLCEIYEAIENEN